VRVGKVEGRIVDMGLRSVVLRARDGTESTIPNHRFLASEVVRLNLGVHDAPCEFEVVLPEGRSLETETRRLVEAAMLSPFAAPGGHPEVFVVAGEDGELRLRVRAYVFDRSYEERYRGDILARFEARGGRRRNRLGAHFREGVRAGRAPGERLRGVVCAWVLLLWVIAVQRCSQQRLHAAQPGFRARRVDRRADFDRRFGRRWRAHELARGREDAGITHVPMGTGEDSGGSDD
jgi:hypothetical protein